MTITLTFVRRQHESDNATSFFFQPEVPLPFQAGQYLRYTLPHPEPDTRGVSRSFTIASSPDELNLRLTTRLSTLPSTFKQALGELEPGARVEAGGPYGQFVYTETDMPAVFIAGSIGITPFRAILGDLDARKLHARCTLLYSSGNADIPFRAYFDSLTAEWPELRVIYTVTRPSPSWPGLTGRIDPEFVREYVPDLARPLFFVCGPTGLVDAMRGTLAETGVDASRIKFETFPGYDSRSAAVSLTGGSHAEFRRRHPTAVPRQGCR